MTEPTPYWRRAFGKLWLCRAGCNEADGNIIQHSGGFDAWITRRPQRRIGIGYVSESAAAVALCAALECDCPTPPPAST